ncbi:MAG: 3-deoxy-manno-octulosonate cytidylyltransferase [Flavobacteriales bacterium AspAUS03]
MRSIAVIPARYEASRFPGKMMAFLGNKTLIRRTYEAAIGMKLFDEVLVVTDNQHIFDEISRYDGKALISQKKHETGTDRIAEIAGQLQADIIVNIQGDEPFVQREPLERLLDTFKKDPEKKIDLVTLVQEIKAAHQINDPNYVKVVFDKEGFALYFSRAPIPYLREIHFVPRYFKHIGIYAFLKEDLMAFSRLPILQNEKAEKIECLRFLEHGKKIKVLETDYINIEIDTTEDLIQAQAWIQD